MTERHTQHLGVLDGLRSLAVMLVFARHYALATGSDNTFLLNGWTGINLFFVLSGFLITGQLIETLPREEGPARKAAIKFYFRKRFFRIAPAYYAILTVLYVGSLSTTEKAHLAALHGCYAGHLLFLQDYLCPRYYPLFWSLAVEMKFYLLAPFLVMLVSRFRRAATRCFLILGLMALTLAQRGITIINHPDVIANFDAYFFHIMIPLHLALDGLLVGMFCAFVWHDDGLRALLNKKSATRLFSAGALLVLVMMAMGIDAGVGTALAILAPFALAAGYAAMLLGLLGGCAGSGLFATRPLRLLALVSYSFYLIHSFVLFWLVSYGITGPALALSGFVLTAAVSAVSYRLVERPFIRWSKKKTPRGLTEGGSA